MKITILATLMIFAAYFLLLYGAVGFIHDKRFFSFAPKEKSAAIPDKQERFPARISSAGSSCRSRSRFFSARPFSPRGTARNDEAQRFYQSVESTALHDTGIWINT